MEGADAGLSGTLFDAAVDEDRDRGLTFDELDRRRGGTVDVGDGLERLVGEWESGRYREGPMWSKETGAGLL